MLSFFFLFLKFVLQTAASTFLAEETKTEKNDFYLFKKDIKKNNFKEYSNLS